MGVISVAELRVRLATRHCAGEAQWWCVSDVGLKAGDRARCGYAAM